MTEFASTGILVFALAPALVLVVALGALYVHGIKTHQLDQQIAELQERRALEAEAKSRVAVTEEFDLDGHTRPGEAA